MTGFAAVVMQMAWALPTFLISLLKVPLLSNTWMRMFPPSAAYTLPCASTAILSTPANWPGAVPFCPHDFTNTPSFENFATRALRSEERRVGKEGRFGLGGL